MADGVTIIIKKVKKSHGGGHHGGNWKVAYANFMTAMMAFFLLLWLLNSVSEEKMAGISNYFSPTALSYTMSGAGGMFGGQSMLSPGAMKNSRSEAGVTVSLMPLNENEIPDIEGMPAEKKGRPRRGRHSRRTRRTGQIQGRLQRGVRRR
jgi:flagellar motor protein MotB